MAFLAALVACGATLAVNAAVSEVRPSTAWGMGYGAGAVVLLLGALAYAARRRAPRRGPGRAYVWLQFHLYGGALFLVLVMMHAGFRAPHGVLAWAMWLLSWYVVMSGLVGVFLQRWLPRILSSAFATEVHYDRIPSLVGVIRGRVEALVRTCDDSVRRFYDTNLAPVLVEPQPRFIYFMDIAGGIRSRVGHLDYLRQFLAGEDVEKLDELKALVSSKLEMDAQYTLQRALRWWLLGHVPVSLALVVLVAFHLFSVWYY